MNRASNAAAAAERARWLAELAGAIDQAQRIAWRLGIAEGESAEAKELYGRLESARAEVDALRGNGWANQREEVDPSWMDLLLRRGGRIGPTA